ncbi:MAG: hypothetical protein A2133_07960 [Actinobacteria bacterium RBG_16_64_13]|nr:MAG: hypothetical protein A2133_07960 [Actinobacteria bacterium RBG_16_64_13]
MVTAVAARKAGWVDMAGTPHLRGAKRREQIIEATLSLVAEYGVTGTTLSRIAGEVGVTTPALYAHFANRKEILLSALDVLIQKRTALHRLVSEGTPIERLREIGHRHSELAASENDKSVIALFEFIAAPPEEGLRETLGHRHLLIVEDISQLVREGQREGAILEHVDPQQVAWMVVSRAWTEDIAQLMGVTHEWNRARSDEMLELILASIAAPQSRKEDCENETHNDR